MALRALVCPQCGAKIEVDDNDKDFAFCSFCGTKIQLNEIVSVKHSGTVELDNSKQALNRITIADRAFDSRNFSEAASYYTKALEDFPNDYKALYRKGLCAIYLSSPDNLRGDEFATMMKSALASRDGATAEDLTLTKDNDLSIMVNSLFGYFHSNSSTQSCLDSCVAVVKKLIAIAVFANAAIGYIENESVKEKALSSAVDYCDDITTKKMKYVSSVVKDKKGNNVDVTSVYHIDADSQKKIAELRKGFADQFNNLPGRVEKSNTLTNKVSALETEVKNYQDSVKQKSDAVKLAKDNFLTANPEIAKGRKKAMLPSLIAFLVFLVAAVVMFIIKKSGIGVILLIAMIVIPFFMRRGAVAKYESKNMSGEINAKVAELESEKKKLEESEKALAEAQKALKDFNKTKK